MKHAIRVCVAFGFLAAVTVDAGAAPIKRTGVAVGPEGPGSVTAIASAPSQPGLIYAAFQDVGVGKSTDGGQTFQPIPLSPTTSCTINCLAVHPANPNIVLAAGTIEDRLSGYQLPGFWLSEDGGANWTTTGLQTPYRNHVYISSLEFNPLDAEMVIAGTKLTASIYPRKDPILRSTDHGRSWQLPQSANLPDIRDMVITTIQFDPSTPGRIVAGSAGRDSRDNAGIFESLNYGLNWAKLNVAPFIGTGTQCKPVFDFLAVDNPEPVWLAGSSADPFEQVKYALYKSKDQGRTWTTATKESPYPATEISGFRVVGLTNIKQDLDKPNRLWAVQSTPLSVPNYFRINPPRFALVRSDDFGMTWAPVGGLENSLPTGLLHGLVLQPSLFPAVLTGSMDWGLIRTSTDGLRVEPAAKDLPYATARSMVTAGANHNHAAAVIKPPFAQSLAIQTGDYNGQWIWNEPIALSTTGTIDSLVSDPNSLSMAAALDGQLHTSGDGGNTWIPSQQPAAFLANGIPGTSELFLHDGQSLLKSDNFGDSFSSIGAGLDYTMPVDLSVSPNGNRLAIAAKPLFSHSGPNSGVFVSDDGGNTFQKRNHNLSYNNDITWLQYAEGSSTDIFAVSERSLLRSADEGESWTVLPSPEPMTNIYMLDIADYGTSRSIWYLDFNRAFRSDDDGLSWKVISPFSDNNNIWQLAVAPTSPNCIFATAYGQFALSADAGETWTTRSMDIVSTRQLIPDISDPNTIYLATYNEVYRSSDEGTSWTKLPQIPGAIGVNCLTSIPNQQLLAGTYSGIWRYSPVSNSWSNNFTHDSETQQIVLAGNFAYCYDDEGRVYKSDGYLGGWTYQGKIPYKRYSQGTHQLAVDPTNPNILLLSGYSDTLYKSTNGGVTWHEASEDLWNSDVVTVALSPTNPNLMLAGTTIDGIYRSVDAGLNWGPCSIGSNRFMVNKIIANPTNGNEFLAATNAGLLYTPNGGVTWKTFCPELDNVAVNDVYLQPGIAGMDVFASTEHEGIWTTLNTARSAAAADWNLFD